MHPIEYASPNTREQAVKLLGSDPAAAAPLAGGSDLLGLMKSGVETPKRLVNLKGIAGLTGVRNESGGLRIGALTVLDDLAADAALGFEYPTVTAAAGRLAGPQIRNVATLGGNLLQRPRCWYYRNGFGLLALKDGKSMVVDGDYRYHAILGNEGPAYFVSPSTLAPVLVAVGAQAVLFGPQGERRIELEKLYRIPKLEGEREHDLKPGEILTDVLLPPAARSPATRCASARRSTGRSPPPRWPWSWRRTARWLRPGWCWGRWRRCPGWRSPPPRCSRGRGSTWPWRPRPGRRRYTTPWLWRRTATRSSSPRWP